MPLDVVTDSTPWASLAGGVLIGLSATLVLLLFGRIAGISGITAGAVPGRRPDWPWRLAFLVGLVAAPALVGLVTGERVAQDGAVEPAGDGAGGGCSSGPAPCSAPAARPDTACAVWLDCRVARWSPCSSFMATAFATVAVLRHLS